MQVFDHAVLVAVDVQAHVDHFPQLAAGEARTKAVQRGIEYLLRTQTAEGSWYEPEFTGTGFPKYFFIKYHMYQHYFPLMALARYRQSLMDM